MPRKSVVFPSLSSTTVYAHVGGIFRILLLAETNNCDVIAKAQGTSGDKIKIKKNLFERQHNKRIEWKKKKRNKKKGPRDRAKNK